MSSVPKTRYSVSAEGTDAAKWDMNTWPELQKLAEHHPESGVYFQGLDHLYILHILALTQSRRNHSLHSFPGYGYW